MVEAFGGEDVAPIGGSKPGHSIAWRYLAMAESYALAVEHLAPLAESSVAPYHMMVGHALELSLKAVSAHVGSDEEWLVMSGHNLHHCYRQAFAAGFHGQADSQLESLVKTLDGPHRDQRFRYPVFFRRTRSLVTAGAAQVLRLHMEDVRTWLNNTPPVQRRPLRQERAG